ncbi:hypothetical protein DFJ74DRAFT_34022 [Hyaloraphidium curvatum]|nr:hypothetical protein DFJ74DRAFT_34022 [Hyaloraphidium curvatum]
MDISSAEHLLSSNLEEEASEVPAGADVPQEAVPAAPAAGNGTQDSPDGGDRDAVTEEAAAAQGAAEDRSAKLLPSFSGWGFPSSFSWGKVMESGGKMMQTVKKQTEGVIDVYRKDITELVNVVTTETTQVAEKLKPVMVSTTGTVVENLKNIVFEDSDEEDEEPTEFEKAIEEQVGRLANSAGKVAHNVSERLSSLLNQAVKIRGADDDKKKSKKLIYDPKQVLVAALRADPATFLEDPHESTASPNELLHDDKADTSSPLQRAETRFQAFRTDFNIAEHAGQISRILNEDAEMKRMLERIVPAQASYEQFWQRYFFKIAEIDVLEARRKALMQGVQTADDEEFTWDEDDSSEEAAANSPSDAQPDAEAKDAAPKDAEPKEPEVSEGIVSSVSNHLPRTKELLLLTLLEPERTRGRLNRTEQIRSRQMKRPINRWPLETRSSRRTR